MDQGYTLTIIEDEPIALAGEMSTPVVPIWYYVGLGVVAVIIICICFFLVNYLLECNKYRSRYSMLLSDTNEKPQKLGWNLKQLKELVMEEEANRAGQIMDDAFHLS